MKDLPTGGQNHHPKSKAGGRRGGRVMAFVTPEMIMRWSLIGNCDSAINHGIITSVRKFPTVSVSSRTVHKNIIGTLNC